MNVLKHLQVAVLNLHVNIYTQWARKYNVLQFSQTGL